MTNSTFHYLKRAKSELDLFVRCEWDKKYGKHINKKRILYPFFYFFYATISVLYMSVMMVVVLYKARKDAKLLKKRAL